MDIVELLRTTAPIDMSLPLLLMTADEIERLSTEVSNLKLANEEARKTIDRLNEMLPHEANSGA